MKWSYLLLLCSSFRIRFCSLLIDALLYAPKFYTKQMLIAVPLRDTSKWGKFYSANFLNLGEEKLIVSLCSVPLCSYLSYGNVSPSDCKYHVTFNFSTHVRKSRLPTTNFCLYWLPFIPKLKKNGSADNGFRQIRGSLYTNAYFEELPKSYFSLN